MKQIFEPQDFYAAIQYSIGAEECKKKIAKIANAKIEKLKEASPLVYGYHMSMENYWKWTEYENVSSTRKGVLMFIETIVKTPCEHKSIVTNYGNHPPNTMCLECKKNLVPTGWKEV